MSDVLHTNTDSVRSGADQLAAATEGVRTMFGAFQNAAGGYADAFGGDEIGMLLGIAHQACVDAVTECMTTNVADLEDYVECLRLMADRIDAVDEQGAQSFTGILGSMG